MKKLTAFFSAAITLLTLCACGAAGGDAGADALALSAGSEETYTYSAGFTELGGMENYLTLRCRGGDGFYATAGVMVSNTIPAGVTPDYETQYYQYEQRLYFIGLDGTVRRLRSYAPIVLDEEHADKLYYTQSTTVAAMLMGGGGELTALELVDEGWYKRIVSASGKESAGDYAARQRWFIRTLDDSGAELSCVEIKLGDDETLDGGNAVTDGGGGFIMPDKNGLRCVDALGETLWRIDSAESVGRLLKLGGGTVCALSWGDCWSARVVDAASGTLGESVRMPQGVYAVFAGGGQEILYNNGDMLCAFDAVTGGSREILSWLNCDINAESVSGLAALSDGGFAGIVTAYGSGSGCLTELFTLSRERAGSASAKTMSYATISLDSQLRSLIITHNRAGTGTRIVVKDYSGYSDGAARLTADIRSGDAADIIDLDGLDVSALASEGLLADLYPCLDADSELSRDDYFENFLASCEYDGALICVCPSFYVRTVIAAQSVTGDALSWTGAEFDAAAQTMDADCSILEYYSTRYDVLRELLALCHDELVDSAAGTCDFQTELFSQLLRFASYFPQDYDWSAFTGGADDSTYFRLRTGRQMLSCVNICSPEDIFACDADFEDGASFIGFPVAQGSGSGLVRDAGLAVGAKSRYTDEAWAFIRQFLTEDCQRGCWGIPGLKSLYEEELAAAMTTEYYKDSYGGVLLDDDGQPIPKARCSFGDKNREGDSVTVFYAVTDGQADRLEKLLSGTVRTFVYDEALFKIVRDKTTAYFAGTLSAEDACAAVQGAVTEYLKDR